MFADEMFAVFGIEPNSSCPGPSFCLVECGIAQDAGLVLGVGSDTSGICHDLRDCARELHGTWVRIDS